MTLSLALAEFYASADQNKVAVVALTFDHPGFPELVHVISNVDPDPTDPGARVVLPDEDGNLIAFLPVAFSYTPPGHDADGPTDGRLRVDNVSHLLEPYLELALGYNEPVHLIVRVYLTNGTLGGITAPDEVVRGLVLNSVELSAVHVEGTLTYIDGRDLNVPTGPHAFFDRDNYPALFG